ncbi:MAG: hypothetical protein M1814_000222 [Vezdaea aestivalis]|nr:MAG: hypothetical protein M1814_000222 [Vezdaea aestivalis]
MIVAAARARVLGSMAARRLFSSSVRHGQETWGFVGLGRMGWPMAKNLRAKIPANDIMIVHDINHDLAQKFAAEFKSGVTVAEGYQDVARDSETVFTVLPEASHVKNVFQGLLHPQLPSLDKQRLFIDCSTIDPVSSREVARAVHHTDRGIFVDAPMSGGVVGAEAATLTFMLGAPDHLVDRVTQILQRLGSRTVHCGEQGLGLSAKLANNYLLAISNIATAEAMNLGVKMGLDPNVLAGLINASSGRCWSSEINNPVPGVVADSPASKGYIGGFGVGLMKKDLGLAVDAAKEAEAVLKLDGVAQEIYEELEAGEGFKGKDFSVVYKQLSEAE